MAAAFIAGDWGTSRLRLSLCDAAGFVLESRDGPGIAQARGRVEDAFFEQIAPWEKHGRLPAILSGMVGSTIGWREAACLPCPIAPETLARSLLHFEARGHGIALAPGLSCRNRLGAPDYMRGEETQILGALRLEPSLRQGRRILCLPGTHTKWVSMLDGVIEHCLTAPSGELYNILHRHSVLVNSNEEIDDAQAFAQALERISSHPEGGLIHFLFEARSLQLSGELDPRQAASYLSGLVIAEDVSGASRILRIAEAGPVTLIGAPRLAALYGRALKTNGIECGTIEGNAASLQGLTFFRDAANRTP
ncbi:MAG TPA: 2-dehydro-3-deoxygalactonokinase [Rhizomicrobium sp.]